MDWKTLRRDKLAKTSSYKPDPTRTGGWWNFIDRGGDLWARFIMLSWWEKGMVIGTAVLLAVLAPLGMLALTNGGGESNAVALATSTEAPAVINVGPSPTSTLVPTNTPKAVPNTPTPTDTPAPNREDCDAIRGTAYLSGAEADWFLDNCDFEPDPGPDDPGRGPADTATPIPVPPTSTPVPAPSISASQASIRAAAWIANNPEYGELDIAASSCIPQQVGSGWRVGCTGSASGCVGACAVTVWVCVDDSSVRQC